MSDVERWQLLYTLSLAGGHRENATNILDVGARTLCRKLREYDSTI